jgi:hypothetical protein
MRDVQSTATALIAVFVVAASAAALAQPAPQRLRGKVVAVTPNTVTIETSTHAKVPVTLSPDWALVISAKIAVTAIKPGSFVGTTNVDVPGGGRAVEVHVFPPGSKIGEGQRVMDAGTSTMMTNGTVQSATRMTNGGVRAIRTGRTGLEIDVTFPGGVRHVIVPPNALITSFTPTDRSKLKPGIMVSLTTAPDVNGKPIARFVTTGPNGGPPAR